MEKKTVHKGYSYRLLPTEDQAETLRYYASQCRKVWNLMLSFCNMKLELGERIPSFSEMCRALAELKKDPDFAYLKEGESISQQQTLRHLSEAFKRFFAGTAGMPVFKSKNRRADSFTVNLRAGSKNLDINQRHQVWLPKLGQVEFLEHRKIPDNVRVLSATVTIEKDGGFTISFTIEEEAEVCGNNHTIDESLVLGMDMGLRSFAAVTDPQADPALHGFRRFYRDSEKKLAWEERKLSRKQYGSHGYEKQRAKVARLHRHIASQRKDFLHKYSRYLVENYAVIAIEDLSVKEIAKEYGKSILDLGWYSFVRMLEYKAEETGCIIYKCDRFFPSSQLCNNCGHRNPEVRDLKIRAWTCEKCGTCHDRDMNAAINMKKSALEKYAV